MAGERAMNLNEVRLDRVVEAMRITADVLRGGPPGEERLEFRMLLHGFAVNGTVLEDWHREHLDRLLELREHAGNLEVLSITGHASRTGEPSNNVRLSKERAAAVSGYLIIGGLTAEHVGDVDGTGSEPGVIDVGRSEEAFNRSVELLFAFRYVPRYAGNLPAPTQRWTVDPGLDTSWTFAGRQSMTITRLDTGESRTATFRYIDATMSVGPGTFLRKIFPTRWTTFDDAFEAMPDETVEDALHKFLAGFLFRTVSELAVVPGGGQPRPLVNSGPLDWTDFENTYAVLLEPAAFGFVGADVTYAKLFIGVPPFAGAYVSGLDPGVGSLFPELSSGFKFGTFELDR